jgi:xylulokinase
MDKLLLGIDIGTTGTKSALFDLRGQLQSIGQAEYEVSIPRSGWAEQDPEAWWDAVCTATRSALGKVEDGAERVAGVAVSSQAPTLLALGKNGKPLRPALIWMDRRAEIEAQILKEKMGEGLVEEITGNHPDPFYVASKLLWYKTNEPENFAETSVFLQANGYINFRLTGRFSLDHVHAALLQLRDYAKNEWSDALCKLCGVDPDRFPPILEGQELLGEVTKKASEETGLHAGTPVMVGTVDGSAAALEAGAVEKGIVGEMTGTSTVLFMPNDSGIIEPAFIAMPHVVPGLHLLLAALASTGACLKWYRDQLGTAEVEQSKKLKTSAYDLLTQQAAEARPGSNGVIFLPYMMGERSPVWHTHARGVFFGLSLSTTKDDLIRAILEGTSMALCHNFEVARNAGINIEEIRSVGGGTRSALWNQIKADILGIPVLIPEASIGAPFGDAILAGMGLGYFGDVNQSLRDMIRIRDRYEPDMENHFTYREVFTIFRSIYESLRNDFDRLAALREI